MQFQRREIQALLTNHDFKKTKQLTYFSGVNKVVRFRWMMMMSDECRIITLWELFFENCLAGSIATFEYLLYPELIGQDRLSCLFPSNSY